ncbi:uncharacterized protein CYBJADRAFT_168251 [Cyberlindnera jadinii NRRL Y-1542]|uniref:WHIM1 domain-containing protein n=1 Tax=Cyberlindnera jadinii (strain ATCC 18201 / CBS 1600 / BCRC 20928 / JCM 3617 / NBRC 0987 / NRRL Y-1542) TaxID=983966 RepID=A0A1E4RZM6_CYBJN|nr:hypothetical protein CYBJADRAFT_168251 [Cyberlindnera jadinii NRRL Y-1542]ODV72706.1 hypothetical protein CYBJADRAFT_168251 [Cyberlindnera jadinii NRRL Y-1542]
MESNIDPAIESQGGIFTKFSLNSDFIQGENNYINIEGDEEGHNGAGSGLKEHDGHGETNVTTAAVVAAAAAAAAAANMSSMIHFNGMDDNGSTHLRARDNSHGNDALVQRQGSTDNGNDQQLSFLHSALEIENQARQHSDSYQQREAQHPSHQHHHLALRRDSEPKPKQVLIQDTDSNMSIVVVDPSAQEGGSRLGRPRKHQVNASPSSEQSSSKNYEESMVSRFRVDSKPITGPGSRGGRKIKPKPSVEKNGYKQPVFAKQGGKLILAKRPESHQQLPPIVPKVKLAIKDVKSSNKDKADGIETSPIVLEDVDSLKAKGRSTASDKKLLQSQIVPRKQLLPIAAKPESHKDSKALSEKILLLKTIPKAKEKSSSKLKSRTKKKRDIPGPITGVSYDIYDPEMLKDDEGLSHEQFIALGYEVKPSDYAKDIITILSFINKFKKFFKFANLGPQDIEEGLNLPPSLPYSLSNVNQKTVESPTSNSKDEISYSMNQLFFKLLYLVLNKKKAVNASNVSKILAELKENCLMFGLPSEWRDDEGVFTEVMVDDSLKDDENEEPLDPEHPEALDTMQYHFGLTKPLEFTPLDEENFETDGLMALQPLDRLILLRSLVQWCTSYSDSIRSEISKQLARQDSSGDKETYYIPRYIKQGEKGIEDANANLKLHPRKKIKKTNDDENTLDPYTDASANPLDHHMSFRIMDFYAGDGGLSGRYFLCRSCDPETGGLASLDDMKKVINSQASVTDMLGLPQPSRFKLYVQDVTSMIKSVTNEVNVRDQTQTVDPWYEVASNVSELRQFINFLESKLATADSKLVETKRLKDMVYYLTNIVPVLEKFETIYNEYKGIAGGRQSRKRGQVTDLKENDLKMKKMIKLSEDPDGDFLYADGEFDEDDFDDDDDVMISEPDDADDDDYQD